MIKKITDKNIFHLPIKQNIEKNNISSIQSIKYINFLQYCFYKELNSNETNSDLNFDKNIYYLPNLGRKINIQKLNNKNGSHFFPYRKTWINYWLLPFIGFVSSFSNNYQTEKLYCQEQILNSHNVKNQTIPFNNGYYSKVNSLKILDNNFIVQIEAIPNLKLLNFNSFKNIILSDYSNLQVFANFFNLWLENSKIITSTPVSEFFLKNSTKSEFAFHNQFNFQSDLNQSDALFYAPKFYLVPLYQESLNKTNLNSNLETFSKQDHENKSKTNINQLITVFNHLKYPNLNKLNKFSLQKTTSYKTQNFPVSFSQIFSTYSEHSKESLKSLLIGIHKTSKAFHYSLDPIKHTNDFKIFKNKTPLTQYKKASLILDQFYNEIEIIQSLESQELPQKINTSTLSYLNLPKTINSKQILDTPFNENLKNHNLEFYYPKSFDASLKKNLLFNSLLHTPIQNKLNLEVASFNSPLKQELFNTMEKISLTDNLNHHRKHSNFLEKLILFFNSKDLEILNPEKNKFAIEDFKSTVSEEELKGQKQFENLKSMKKLTKEQLYSLIMESFSTHLRHSGEIIVKPNLNENIKINYANNLIRNQSLLTERSNQFPTNHNNKILKLNHPLLFTNLSTQTYEKVEKMKPQTTKINHSNLKNSLNKNIKTVNSFVFSPTNLKSEEVNLLLTKTINSKTFKAGPYFVNTQSKNPFRKEYSSNYINYLSFKLQKMVQKNNLKNLAMKVGQLEFNNEQNSLTQQNLNDQSKKLNIEKIFRSYLSKKYKLIKTSSNKLKSPNQKFKILRKTELKLRDQINFVNPFVKSKLKQNFSVKNQRFKIINLFKNHNLNFSFNSLLKHRAFILKTNSLQNQLLPFSKTEIQQETVVRELINQSYFEKLEKRKYLQKKYRRKKQRKETRRRKKRKRFYPRPTWIRFKLYKNLLTQLSSENKLNIKKIMNLHSKRGVNTISANQLDEQELKNYSIFSNSLKSNKIFSNHFVQNFSLYSTKDFYQLKTSVIGELKRSFWKSYWLRSNLKPYLNRIKTDLTELKQISIKQTVNLNVKKFLDWILGLNCNNNLISKKLTDDALLQWTQPISEMNLYLLSTKWQLITQIAEHNRITYNRIQNLVLNIRENLNINGQFKARPYKHFTHQKLKSLTSLKQNSLNNQNTDFWVKIEKNKLIRSLFHDSYKYYGSFSNYRLLWAINKSNLGQFKSTNKVKDLWMNTKNRDQSKANKTKKILYQVSQNYSVLLHKSGINNQKFKLTQDNIKNIPEENKMLGNFSNLKDLHNLEKITRLQKTESVTLVEKCLKQSERKLKQKQQKLRLILGRFYDINKIDQKQITEQSLKNLNILTPTQFKYYTNEYNYWWNEAKLQTIPVFNSLESKENRQFPLWVSSFIFHFCTIISLISISQVRDVIKFSLILVSKISKIYLDFIYFSFNSTIEFSKKLIPTKSFPNTVLKLSSNYYKNSKFKSIFSNASNIKLHFFQTNGNFKFNTKNRNSNRASFHLNNQLKNMILQNQNSTFKPKLYFGLLSYLKNSLMFFQLIPRKNSNQMILILKFKQNFLKVFYYSALNSFIFSVKNLSFFTYSYFLKTLNFVETFIRSIYSFFEKPGELIIDWMAYLFLVEWASDLTTTIPDTIDTSFSYSISKYSRLVRFPLISTTNISSNLITNFSPEFSSTILVPTISSFSSVNSNLFPFLTFNVFGGSLVQRRSLALYEMLLTIACRPDTDLRTRQLKGHIFWDAWSDLLIEVAEKSNINISELNNLKEEQNRLLEQLLGATKSANFSQFSSVMSKEKIINKNSLLKQKNLNFISDVIFKSWQSNLVLFENNNSNLQLNSQNLSLWKRWSTNQFLSYQGKDTELFIDLHPPKSFANLTSIKFSQSIQQPIGLVLCQIFSGIFYKQIAKNLLVIGPTGNEKSLLIQAIAGETELKIITDNAYRYAMVFRGVAVGIKLLRDVFEALTLHTPCIFLLEDIHAIGERRPLLISDDENTKGTESSFSTEREEVHEKNQVIYQLTKHIISHYKKPYKGDFSLLIPTNHFCFDLYNSLAVNEKQTEFNFSPLSPISLTTKTTTELVETGKDKQKNKTWDNFETNLSSGVSKKIASSLQIQKNQLLAPPATSPFSVLVLKEEKKFKPKKLVKELPWAGLPGEQFSNISKSTYSIRIKVALLADSVLSNLSVKLDMITDLLVIIDSVKGNRGFVVFATTHVPYILDPALRRPGRFDETLSLPQIPNLLSRWEILNSNLSVWQPFNLNLNSLNTSCISKNISIKNSTKFKMLQSLPLTLNYGEPFSVYPIGVSISPWENNFFKQVLNHPYNLTCFKVINRNSNFDKLDLSQEMEKSRQKKLSIISPKKYFFLSNNIQNSILTTSVKSVQLMKLKQLNLQKIYSVVSQILLSLQYSVKSNITEQKHPWGDFAFSLGSVNYLTSVQDRSNLYFSTFHRVINVDSLVYMSLYSSPHIFKQHLTILMAGQIGQTFARSFGSQKPNYKLSSTLSKNYTLKGLEPPIITTWKTATSLVYSFIQKRIIYQKKLIVPKFLNFGLESSKTVIPSPPASNILLPAKRYENFKRTFTFSQFKTKTQLSIGEKIQMHQQQRLVKRLYKVPLKEYFRSEILNSFKISMNDSLVNAKNNSIAMNSNLNNLTTFSNASIILAPLEKSLTKATSINWYFRNRILNRHQTYLANQWWNGQLQEHNTESTFLSDIDWRYSYFMTQSSDGNIGDLFIDFPDSEQYYNSKNQRWINTSGLWNSWFDLEKNVYNHSSEHYIYECLMDAFKYLDQNRELLDYYVINIHEKGLNTNKNFNDHEILEIFIRFSGFNKS